MSQTREQEKVKQDDVVNVIEKYLACMNRHSKYDRDYSEHIDQIYRKNQRTQCKRTLHEDLCMLLSKKP